MTKKEAVAIIAMIEMVPETSHNWELLRIIGKDQMRAFRKAVLDMVDEGENDLSN